MSDINPEIGKEEDQERWIDLHKEVVNSGYQLIKRKGYTSSAIALSCSNIVDSIIRNSGSLHTVSVYVKVSQFLTLFLPYNTDTVNHIYKIVPTGWSMYSNLIWTRRKLNSFPDIREEFWKRVNSLVENCLIVILVAVD